MASAARHSVLVVEDDPIYLELLQEAFTAAGFHTLHADNGEKALAVLRREDVELVVSDFIMPEVNGLELCRLVTEDLQFAGVKVILYSCNSDSAFRRRAREMGAIDYLPKAEDAALLVRQICQLAGIGVEELATASGETSPLPPAPEAGQLRLLFDHLLDLIQIAALAEHASEPARVAWESAQRNSGQIRRLLRELENHDRPRPAASPEAEPQAAGALPGR
jgi:CheY-like chemotaxis protein